MLFLLLAVSCSLAIGMIFKYTGRQQLDRVALLTVNYAVALGVAGVLVAAGAPQVSGGLSAGVGLFALSVATGALFILGFFLLALATEVAGMSLAIGVMRVSVVIPFLASWWIWSEAPTPAQGAGLIVAGAAFFLIARKEQAGIPIEPLDEPSALAARPEQTGPAGRAFVVLAALFLAGGLVDTLFKTFDELYAADNSRALFLLLVFGIAFLIGAALVGWKGLRQGVWPGGKTLVWGGVLGLVNYGSAEFFLQSVAQLKGPFVFPANNVAIMIGAALLGVLVWGEHLSRLNWLGLGLAAFALVLLGL